MPELQQQADQDSKEKARKIKREQELLKKIEDDKKEQEEKERIKKKKAAEMLTCIRCGKEIFPARLCICPPTKGGGIEETEENRSTDFIAKLLEMASQIGNAILRAKERTLTIEPPLLGLLSDAERKELSNYIDAILKELIEFRKENGISAECVKIQKDSQGSLLSFSIELPTYKLYAAFIQRLAKKNLLPWQVLEQQEKKQIMYQNGMNHFNPTFFSTKLTYAACKKSKLTDEELRNEEKQAVSREENINSIYQRTPWNSLKPKGFK